MSKRRLKTLPDLRRYIADVINRVEAGTMPESKAKTLGYLCNCLRGVIEGSEIDARLTEIETKLRQLLNERPTP